MQAITTQRNPAYFPDPDKFDPSRWISDEVINPGTPEMREMMLVWAKGSRVCLSQRMPTMEIKILLVRVLGQLDVRLQSEQTHADMEMTDHFTLIPEGKRCGLIFSRIKNA
jgi:cytochrome P450